MESPIRYRLDSQLFSDSIRVLTGLLRRLARNHKIVSLVHRRRAKRRCLNIGNHRVQCRQPEYRDLLKVARKTAAAAGWSLRRFHERVLRVASRVLRQGRRLIFVVSQRERDWKRLSSRLARVSWAPG